MSRTYAKVKISIWGDTDFRELSETAQALYFKLLTSPTLRLCGVADWRPKRIAALTRGQTVRDVEAAARELEEHLYVIFDEDTEEALLRTFIKHDGVLKTPNVAASMVKDFAAVASASLRGIIVYELHKLSLDEPEHKGWPVVREVLDNPSIDPSVKVSIKVSTDVSTKGEPTTSADASGNDAHIPQPPTINHQPPEGDELSSDVSDDPTPPERAEVEAMLDYLDSRIAAEGIREPPTRTKKNRDAARRMLDRDGYDPHEIRAVIDWATRDQFWATNIGCAAKLREKYQTLRAQMLAPPKTAPRTKQDRNLAVLAAAEQRWTQQDEHHDRRELA